jgi:hypothetical protein
MPLLPKINETRHRAGKKYKNGSAFSWWIRDGNVKP